MTTVAVSPFEPFDLFAFAGSAGQAAGRVELAGLPRMIAERADAANGNALLPADAGLDWMLEGWHRSEPGDVPRDFVRLRVRGAIDLVCQRCLQPYVQSLDIETTFEVMRSDAEADAAPLDDDEVDVIVGSRTFDLAALVEDEMLLALPLAPHHDVCPELPAALERQSEEGLENTPEANAAGKPSPFAVLAKLKAGDGQLSE